jgi:hypothetical protein
MCRIASLFLLQRLKESMPGDASGFNDIEMRAVIKFFFFSLQGKVPKEIHAILIETLGEHAPSYATVKNWVWCEIHRPRRNTSLCPYGLSYYSSVCKELENVCRKQLMSTIPYFLTGNCELSLLWCSHFAPTYSYDGI